MKDKKKFEILFVRIFNKKCKINIKVKNNNIGLRKGLNELGIAKSFQLKSFSEI